MSTSEEKVLQYLHEAQADRARARPRPAVADRDDAARQLPRRRSRRHLRRDRATTRDARPAATRASSARARNPVSAAVGVVETRRRPGPGARQDAARPAARVAAARRRSSRTPRTPAPPRPSRSPPTPRSSGSPARVGDDETARLAASIRADEERMLARVLREIPKLTDAVVGADVQRRAELRHHRRLARRRVREPDARSRAGARDARQADRPPGPQGARRRPRRGPGQGRGGVRGGPRDRPLRRADRRGDHRHAWPSLSQIDLAKVAAYERKQPATAPRSSSRVDRAAAATSRGPGTTSSTADEVRAVLAEGDDDRAQATSAPTSAPTRTAPGSSRAADRQAATA